MALVDRFNAGARKVPPWTIYVAGGLWIAWLFYTAATGGMGPEPIKALEHRYGLQALQLLIAGLCITPLRRYAKVNLIGFRRAIGLTAFAFVVAHMLVWAVLDVQTAAAVWKDILKRPYITIGMAAFVLLVPLALTSNNAAIRRIGPVVWRRLHKLTYAIVLLGCLHFVMLTKGWQPEPLLYLGVTGALLLLRLPLLTRVLA